MPFTGAISNQSSIRSGASFDRRLVIHTPDVVCQAQPSANATGRSNASVIVGTPTSGSVAAVKADYTVLITPTADYANDLQRLAPTEYLVTYARNDGSGNTIDIGETTYQWSTGDYVTVLKDVRLHSRKLRYTEARVEYRDYDITFRTPKPRIYDLYSEALEIASGDSTVTKAFTPSAVSMNGGTISTWSWDTDGQTISTGTSSDQNISVDFAAGTHLVSLTVTDSDGVSNSLHVLIAAVPADYNSVVHDGITVDTLDHSEDGHVCTFTQYTDIEPILPGSMAMVFTKVRYADGTSLLHTDMVGWIGDITQESIGDATYQRLQSARIGLLDIGFLMQNISVQGLPFELRTSPAAWGQLKSCTPLDVAWHVMSELTTIANIAAVDFPSGYGSNTIKFYDSPNGTLIDTLRSLAFFSLASSLQFAPNGELVFEKALPYETTANRNAATTVATLSTQDCDMTVTRPPAGGIFAVRYVNCGVTRYDTTTGKMRNFYGRAPAEVENGILEEVIRFMVVPEDTGAIAGTAYAGGIAYDHWEASNDNMSVQLNCLGGYLELRQNQFTWLKLSASEGDLINSDNTFDSNTRFVITNVSQQYDAQLGSLTVFVNAREETGDSTNYSIVAQELFEAIVQAALGNVPPVPAYPQLTESTPEDTYSNDSDSYEDETAGVPDPAEDPEAAADNANDPSGVLYTLQVPMTGETISTPEAIPAGNYLITVSGVGVIETIGDFYHVTFDSGGYSDYSITSGSIEYSLERESNVLTQLISVATPATFDAEIQVRIDLGSEVSITDIDWKGYWRYSTADNLINGTVVYEVILYDASVSQVATTGEVSMAGDDEDVYNDYNYAPGTTAQYVDIRLTLDRQGSGSARVSLDNIQINTSGTTNNILSDAHFKITPDGGVTALGGAAGIYFNGADDPLSGYSPNGYSPEHIYQRTQAGSDTVWTFRYVDPDGTTTDNSGALTVRIEEY